MALVSNPANASHEVFFEETRVAAGQLGIPIQLFRAREGEEIDRAFREASQARADAMLVFDDPVLWSHRKRFVAHAAKARLPTMYGYRELVDEGGLISYGPKREGLYRRTAIYVDKILKGANPAELPVERPTKFELVINAAAAKSLGLVVPQSVLLLADELIQ